MKPREKLISLRKGRALTQREVAEQLDITTSFYGMIELGKRNPTLELAKDIADFFGLDIEEIFFNAPNNKLLFKEGNKPTGTTG